MLPNCGWLAGFQCYNTHMSVEELEKTIAMLPPKELSRFRDWFIAFDATNWDTDIETDVAKGQLDALADEAAREHRKGDSTPL